MMSGVDEDNGVVGLDGLYNSVTRATFGRRAQPSTEKSQIQGKANTKVKRGASTRNFKTNDVVLTPKGSEG